MKKKLISALSCAMVLLLTGCKIVDASVSFETVGVTLPFMAHVFDPLPFTRNSDLPQTKAATNAFSVTRLITISELGEKVANAANIIKDMSVNNLKITVTAEPKGKYTIDGLAVTVSGLEGSPFIIPTFKVGDNITPPAGMADFIAAFFMKVLEGKGDITISGHTDAPYGTTIFVIIENNLVFTVSML